jgi:hypothetical protein
MKKLVRILAACALALSAQSAWATPSTLFWTPATTYVQPFLVPHVGLDTYFNDKAAYPLDFGLTMGVLPFEKVQAEVGLDAFLPYWSPIPGAGFFAPPAGPLMVSGKIGLTEGAFGEWFPGISAGIYGVGFTAGTSFDILHAEVGKAFFFGTITAGGYYGVGGSDLLWTGSGGVVRGGFIGSYLSPDIVLDLKGLNKINFFADIQTGKNAFGAVGAGIGFYFTPSIDILTGPIFFLDKASQPPFGAGGSSVMWSVQLDIDIDFGPAPKPPSEPAKAEPAKS